MNASHAATVIMYELFQSSQEEKINDHIESASEEDKKFMLDLVETTLAKMTFATEDKRETHK